VHPQLIARAAEQGGVFAAWQAREHGYSTDEIRQLVRSGRWVPLRRGSYAERSVLDAADARQRHALDISAVLLAMRAAGKDARIAASHRSAAVLWRLETLATADRGGVRLTAARRRHQRVGPGLVVSPAAFPRVM
jgi:hypothetical protein